MTHSPTPTVIGAVRTHRPIAATGSPFSGLFGGTLPFAQLVSCNVRSVLVSTVSWKPPPLSLCWGSTVAAMALLRMFGRTVSDVLRDEPPRTTDVVELWSGVGHVAQAARKCGMQAHTFDIEDDHREDITTESGFMKVCATSLPCRLQLPFLTEIASAEIWGIHAAGLANPLQR